MKEPVPANDRLLRALFRQPVDRTPVWVMRQAGRYLPEYRATRERAGSFLKLCQTPELACEVTLQPLARFDLDAAIIFSDILTVPDAMGLGLSVVENVGPRFAHTVRSRADLERLGDPDPETELRYVMDAIRLARKALDGRVPLIGFAGSPWTLATYMVEGGSGGDFKTIKGMLYAEPGLLHRLLERLAGAVTHYLNAQIAAGAQTVMLFDSWGGVLDSRAYTEFSLQYLERIVAGLGARGTVPVIVFSKGAGHRAAEVAAIGCDCLGLDWTVDLGAARRSTGGRVSLQGNLDPAVLTAPPDVIRAETARVLESYGRGPGHVFNLGHGITPDIDPGNVAVLVDAVHELSRPFHA